MGVNRYIRRPGADAPAAAPAKPKPAAAPRDLTPIKAEIRRRVLDEQLADPSSPSWSRRSRSAPSASSPTWSCA